MSVIGEKIKSLRTQIHDDNGKELTATALAEALNITQSYQSAIEKGKRYPSRELCKKYAEYFNVSLDSLIDDSRDIAPLNGEISLKSNVRRILGKNQLVAIPKLSSFQPCAGNGNAYAELEWAFQDAPYFIPKNDLLGYSWQSGEFYIAEIKGNSMEPQFSDGDNVLFVRGQDCSSGDIVVAVWCDKVYIRGYFVVDGGIELRPRATGYETIRVPLGDEQLCILGKVIRSYPKPRDVLGFYN